MLLHRICFRPFPRYFLLLSNLWTERHGSAFPRSYEPRPLALFDGLLYSWHPSLFIWVQLHPLAGNWRIGKWGKLHSNDIALLYNIRWRSWSSPISSGMWLNCGHLFRCYSRRRPIYSAWLLWSFLRFFCSYLTYNILPIYLSLKQGSSQLQPLGLSPHLLSAPLSQTHFHISVELWLGWFTSFHFGGDPGCQITRWLQYVDLLHLSLFPLHARGLRFFLHCCHASAWRVGQEESPDCREFPSILQPFLNWSI